MKGSKMRTVKIIAAATIALGSFAFTSAEPAMGVMHLRLTASMPAKDSSYASAPTELRLWYSQEPQLRLSSVTLTGPAGAVPLGRVMQDSVDRKLLRAVVDGEMRPGRYTITWRTASSDGHAIRGEIPFTLR
jgi:methionine-rich copper-binding protein CopC